MNRDRLFKFEEIIPGLDRCYKKPMKREFISGGSSSYKGGKLRDVILQERGNIINKISDMISDLPDTEDLVKVNLFKKAILQEVVNINDGLDSNLDIESLIDKSKNPIERRLENI